MATPSVRSIRSGEHEDFDPGQDPFAPGRASFSDSLRGAQQQIDQYGRILGQFPNVRQEGNQAVDDRSWWERNSGWVIPALMLGGTVGAGTLLAPAAAGAAGGASAGSAAANAIPFGVGPTTFGAGSAAGTAAAGLTPAMLAENAAAGSGVSGLLRNAASEAAGGGLREWLNPRNLAALGLAGAGAVNSFREPAGQDRLEDLFNLALERSQKAGPLFDSLNTMAQSQMPAYTRGNRG